MNKSKKKNEKLGHNVIIFLSHERMLEQCWFASQCTVSNFP